MTWIVLATALWSSSAMLLMYGIGIYNRLVTLENRFENAFAQD